MNSNHANSYSHPLNSRPSRRTHHDENGSLRTSKVHNLNCHPHHTTLRIPGDHSNLPDRSLISIATERAPLAPSRCDDRFAVRIAVHCRFFLCSRFPISLPHRLRGTLLLSIEHSTWTRSQWASMNVDHSLCSRFSISLPHEPRGTLLRSWELGTWTRSQWASMNGGHSLRQF